MNFIAHLKSWWTAHASVILTVCYFLVPSVQHFIDTHPKSAVAGILGIVVAALFSKSPLQKASS